MAEETKKRRKRVKGASGRATTPKNAPNQSTRYTPPVPQSYKTSSRWVPIFMFGFFGLGVILILLNYLPSAPLLPGDTSNWNLLIGLGLICVGFIAATRYR